MREAWIERQTKETSIGLQLNLDGTGVCEIDSGVGFLDHMLTLFAKHGRFDVRLHCEGDTYVDDHHSVEDIGICLGEAFSRALGDKAGIRRYGTMVLPMDEALIMCSLDLSGRSFLGFDLDIPTEKVGSFDTELVCEFWYAFARSAGCTLHFRQFAGSNSHHIIEAAFKACARSLRQAVSIDPECVGEIPSSKGML